MTKSVMPGIDLHSNNLMIGMVDQDGQRLKHLKPDCEIGPVDQFLAPFRARLKSIAVESTYNWYWLVDGLRALSYPVELATLPRSIDTAGPNMPTKTTYYSLFVFEATTRGDGMSAW